RRDAGDWWRLDRVSQRAMTVHPPDLTDPKHIAIAIDANAALPGGKLANLETTERPTREAQVLDTRRVQPTWIDDDEAATVSNFLAFQAAHLLITRPTPPPVVDDAPQDFKPPGLTKRVIYNAAPNCGETADHVVAEELPDE
ncbi:unnamed protein product, partial [Amoebophrya sp. A25]